MYYHTEIILSQHQINAYYDGHTLMDKMFKESPLKAIIDNSTNSMFCCSSKVNTTGQVLCSSVVTVVFQCRDVT